jgi:hypothetical protein
MADSHELPIAPVACTLSPQELRGRRVLLDHLRREALTHYERDDLDLTLHYRLDALDRVRAMVAGEQECCAFMTFAMQDDAQGVHVRMRVPERAREAADDLFALFVGHPEARMAG